MPHDSVQCFESKYPSSLLSAQNCEMDARGNTTISQISQYDRRVEDFECCVEGISWKGGAELRQERGLQPRDPWKRQNHQKSHRIRPSASDNGIVTMLDPLPVALQKFVTERVHYVVRRI
jgi:hypothetical protein